MIVVQGISNIISKETFRNYVYTLGGEGGFPRCKLVQTRGGRGLGLSKVCKRVLRSKAQESKMIVSLNFYRRMSLLNFTFVQLMEMYVGN